MSVDKLVKTHHLSFPDAETLGAGTAGVRDARQGGQARSRLRHATSILRDGLLQEMAHRGQWNEAFVNQIIRSAVELGRKFDFDEAHSMQVAHLCRQLFRGPSGRPSPGAAVRSDSLHRGRAARNRAVYLERQPSQAFAVHHQQQRDFRSEPQGRAAGGARRPLSPPGLAQADAPGLRDCSTAKAAWSSPSWRPSSA